MSVLLSLTYVFFHPGVDGTFASFNVQETKYEIPMIKLIDISRLLLIYDILLFSQWVSIWIEYKNSPLFVALGTYGKNTFLF